VNETNKHENSIYISLLSSRSLLRHKRPDTQKTQEKKGKEFKKKKKKKEKEKKKKKREKKKKKKKKKRYRQKEKRSSSSFYLRPPSCRNQERRRMMTLFLGLAKPTNQLRFYFYSAAVAGGTCNADCNKVSMDMTKLLIHFMCPFRHSPAIGIYISEAPNGGWPSIQRASQLTRVDNALRGCPSIRTLVVGVERENRRRHEQKLQ